MKKLNEFIRNLQDELADAICGDLDNNIGALNKLAAGKFLKDAPRTYAVLKRILDMEKVE